MHIGHNFIFLRLFHSGFFSIENISLSWVKLISFGGSKNRLSASPQFHSNFSCIRNATPKCWLWSGTLLGSKVSVMNRVLASRSCQSMYLAKKRVPRILPTYTGKHFSPFLMTPSGVDSGLGCCFLPFEFWAPIWASLIIFSPSWSKTLQAFARAYF